MDPSEFEAQLTKQLTAIPDSLRDACRPAGYYAYEWQVYWLELPGVEALQVGVSRRQDPVVGRLFPLQFKNQLGLAAIRPLRSGKALSPVYVEVISKKLGGPQQHIAFLRALLDDLYARAARLPFTFEGPTARGVVESVRPPSPLFTLHFLCHSAAILRSAVTVIQARPHRTLHDDEQHRLLAEATEADADVLLSILRNPHTWVPARGFPLSASLQGYAPERVWQRRPEETFDTPENRFVLAFLKQVLVAAGQLPHQTWWGSVPADRQRLIRETSELLRQATAHPMFEGVGALTQLPLNSQVLLRRAGYRECLELWRLFQRARRPLFGALQQAIELREIDVLYEFWCFFRLSEEIGRVLQSPPVLHIMASGALGLNASAEARFGQAGYLAYNEPGKSYSVGLRPDFTWHSEGKVEVVFDAKFRLEGFSEGDADERSGSSSQHTDVYKMHTYRDALQLRAAVIVYPGDRHDYWDVHSGHFDHLDLREILCGDFHGVGALPLGPARVR